MKLKSFALTIFTVGIATFTVTKAAAQEAVTFEVVADGLDNPRGIGFDPWGNLYVAESGRGGDGNDGRCIPSPSSQNIPLCAAENGSVLKITPFGVKETVLSNLASIALSPTGEQAAGPADFKFDSRGNAYLLTGLAGNPNQRDTVLKEHQLGQLYKVNLRDGSLTSIADFGAYELQNNPDGTDLICNPVSFTIKGDYAYVVDGGGNDIYKVALNGSGIQSVKAFAQDPIPLDDFVFPPGASLAGSSGAPTSDLLPPGYAITPDGNVVSQQSVPTAIAQAPNGSLTVTEYTNYPYPEGKARIWSVDDNLTTTSLGVNGVQNTGKEIATGFTELTGVAYDAEGNEYVLQHMNQSEWKAVEQGGNLIGDISGSLIKIAPDGTRTVLLSGNGLEAAYGMTFGPDGNLYISNNARFAGKGQVIKVHIPHQANSAYKRQIQQKVGQEYLDQVKTFY